MKTLEEIASDEKSMLQPYDTPCRVVVSDKRLKNSDPMLNHGNEVGHIRLLMTA